MLFLTREIKNLGGWIGDGICDALFFSFPLLQVGKMMYFTHEDMSFFVGKEDRS